MAVVDYVEKKRDKPPPELELGWNMKSFGGLPELGGALDQPMALMKRIRTALNVEGIWTTYKSLPPKSLLEWKKSNRDAWELIKKIEDDR